MFRFLARQMNALLLLAAFTLALVGSVVGENQIRWIGAGLSLIILEFFVERLTLNERLVRFLDGSADRRTEEQRVSRELAELRGAVERVENQVSNHLVSYLSLLRPEEPNRTFHELKLIYALRGAKTIPGDGIEVGRADSIRLWRDALVDARTWDALSSADDLWEDEERAISEKYQELQRQLGANHRVRRVFVLDSEEEYEANREVLAQQVRILHRSNVRWVLRPRLNGILARRVDITHPISKDLDFAIVDGAFILWFRLDDSDERRLIGSRLVNDPETLGIARQVFNLAFSNGSEVQA